MGSIEQQMMMTNKEVIIGLYPMSETRQKKGYYATNGMLELIMQ